LLKWYDGYRFSDADTHVCNPVSLANFFSKGYKFSNYWDSTGTPEFLLKLSRNKAYDYEDALGKWYGEGIFSAYELDKLDITGLLWQTGYLTIKETRRGRSGLQYRLDFPDHEVAETFNLRLLEFYGSVAKGAGNPLIDAFADAISADDLNAFMTLFQSFMANITYDMHLSYEKYYQTIFYITFLLIGLEIEAEAKTNEGRIDAYIRTQRNVYLFEFKLDKTAEAAISQIADHHYYERFQACGLPITMVGVNFNSEKGRIDDWQATPLQ
ncbi:MAG: PD-(D/E)XK nuclease domain-containing protein, partial [Victivallales bacterium]|nr:PD-(D/E)XK nuclease domain-containing protein [Victivallales bacterium]